MGLELYEGDFGRRGYLFVHQTNHSRSLQNAVNVNAPLDWRLFSLRNMSRSSAQKPPEVQNPKDLLPWYRVKRYSWVKGWGLHQSKWLVFPKRLCLVNSSQQVSKALSMSDKQVVFCQGLRSLLGNHHYILNSPKLRYYLLMKHPTACLQLTKALS